MNKCFLSILPIEWKTEHWKTVTIYKDRISENFSRMCLHKDFRKKYEFEKCLYNNY